MFRCGLRVSPADFYLALFCLFSATQAYSSNGKTKEGNLQWGIEAIHLQEAWQILSERGLQPGEGIVIAHPDTGLSSHPELKGANVRWDLAWNFLQGNNNVFHTFSPYQFPRHGHGTETLSLMASEPSCDGAFLLPKCVTGIAPAAQFIPLRVTTSAIIGGGERLAKAIDYAVERGAHVISISLGDIVPMPKVAVALRQAHGQGVIVVAAAGNSTGGWVVNPAALPEAIAVGGAKEGLLPWEGSSHGRKVDWSAPAAGLAAAFVEKGTDGQLKFSVTGTAGTSDATAVSAGIAALWLSYHGRDALVARYGKENLVEVFRALVKKDGVVTPTGWPVQSYGVGIIDARKVLQAPLP